MRNCQTLYLPFKKRHQSQLETEPTSYLLSFQGTDQTWCYSLSNCLLCCCRRCRMPSKRKGIYLSVHSTSAGREFLQRSDGSSALAQADAEADDAASGGCCQSGGGDWMGDASRTESLVDLERADTGIEIARVKVADANVRIVRATNYLKVVEEAMKRTPGNAELEGELSRARDDLNTSVREKDEAEAEQKLSEVQQHRVFFVKEQREDRQERSTFHKVSFWQHMATYLLYFAMLMNVFITTFGISGGKYDGVMTHDVTRFEPTSVMIGGHHDVTVASVEKYDVVIGERATAGNASYVAFL